MRTALGTFLISLFAPAALVLAQANPPTATAAPAANPLSGHTRMMYAGLKKILMRTAE